MVKPKAKASRSWYKRRDDYKYTDSYTYVKSEAPPKDSELLKPDKLTIVTDLLSGQGSRLGEMIKELIAKKVDELANCDSMPRCLATRTYLYTLQILLSESFEGNRTDWLEAILRGTTDKTAEDGFVKMCDHSYTISYLLHATYAGMPIRPDQPRTLKEAAKKHGDPPSQDPEFVFFWALHFGMNQLVPYRQVAAALSYYLYAIYDLPWIGEMERILIGLMAEDTRSHDDGCHADSFFYMMYCFGPMMFFLEKALPICTKPNGVPYKWWAGHMDDPPATDFCIRYGVSQLGTLVRLGRASRTAGARKKNKIWNNNTGPGYWVQGIREPLPNIIQVISAGWQAKEEGTDYFYWMQVLSSRKSTISPEQRRDEILTLFKTKAKNRALQLVFERAMSGKPENNENPHLDEDYGNLEESDSDGDDEQLSPSEGENLPPEIKVEEQKEDEVEQPDERDERSARYHARTISFVKLLQHPRDSVSPGIDAEETKKGIVETLLQIQKFEQQVDDFVKKEQWKEADEKQSKCADIWKEFCENVKAHTQVDIDAFTEETNEMEAKIQLIVDKHDWNEAARLQKMLDKREPQKKRVEEVLQNAIQLQQALKSEGDQKRRQKEMIQEVNSHIVSEESLETCQTWLDELQKSEHKLKNCQKECRQLTKFFFNFFNVGLRRRHGDV